MALRWNGSILGSRRDPEAAAFSGVWGLRDQALYQRDAYWTPTFKGKPWFGGMDGKLANFNTSTGANVTASSTINTKGAWAEVISSTSTATTCLSVVVTGLNTSTVAVAALVDIGIGASGSESAIAENIAVSSVGQGFTTSEGVHFIIPVSVPSGSRIAVRAQSSVASKTVWVLIHAYDFSGSATLPTSVDVLGSSTTTSSGTQLSASNAWTEIIASTAEDYIALALVPSMTEANAATANLTMELGVGASGSEQSVQLLSCRSGSTEIFSLRSVQLNVVAVNVPAGSRLSARQSTATTHMDACIIAVPKP
jgi:hypothetical protein